MAAAREPHPMAASQARAVGRVPQRLIERELERLPAGALVLSIGEGYGSHVARLADAFPELRFVATDLEPSFTAMIDMHRRSQGLSNLSVCVVDAAHLPFATGSFALTYGRNLLHFVPDVDLVLHETARVTRGVVLFRDVANWPWYPLLRRLQSITLRLRGKRDAAASVRRDAELVSRTLAQTRAHALTYLRRARQTGLFASVDFIGHDLLWWDVDRNVPVIGLIGARFALRCSVAL